MEVKADDGEILEKEWLTELDYLQSKYPEEAAEFKVLLGGGLLPGWESSLPVNILVPTS